MMCACECTCMCVTCEVWFPAVCESSDGVRCDDVEVVTGESGAGLGVGAIAAIAVVIIIIVIVIGEPVTCT